MPVPRGCCLPIGKGQAQALTGTCNSSIITAGNAGNFDQEDATSQPTDTCGDISGTLGSTFNPQILHLEISTTCTAGTGGSTTLAPCGTDPDNCAASSTTTCSFSRNVTGNPGATTTDKVCVSGINGGAVGPTCATASVSIRNVVPTAAVTKTVEKAVCAVVRYDVQVDNTDLVESLQLTALSDSLFGDITKDKNSTPVANSSVDRTDCSVPQTIASSGNYKCTFDALVCTFPHSNRITATLYDNDTTTPIEPQGSATVTGVTLQ